MTQPIETEHKYVAGSVTLGDLTSAVESLFDVTRKLVISGYDDYFSNSNGDYIRHRYNGDRAELTVKRRLSQESTAQRIEVDVHLKEGQAYEVSELAKVLGYEREFSIYKTCVIWWTAEVNIVYYMVYNTDMVEQARIIEIEANKDCLRPLEAIEYAEYVLNKQFSEITSTARLNRSMYEMFARKVSKPG